MYVPVYINNDAPQNGMNENIDIIYIVNEINK